MISDDGKTNLGKINPLTLSVLAWRGHVLASGQFKRMLDESLNWKQNHKKMFVSTGAKK